MNNYAIPQDVAALCTRLRRTGFSAYPVGGAVRDLVLGRCPNDWDVATSARPDQIAALFPTAQPTGLPFGTLTLFTGVRAVEVTTFRRDGPYSDGRRPDYVVFVPDLLTALSRRDFTLNAMALTEEGNLLDPFNGRADIALRRICCVGAPCVRFEEDALRMLRALRLSAQLDFTLGAEEQQVLSIHASWARRVSAERICTELERALLGCAPERTAAFFSLGLLDHLLCTPAAPDLRTLSLLPPDPSLRWARLCRQLLRCGAVTDPTRFLQSLHMERSRRRCILAILAQT